MTKITADRLRHLLFYNSETGKFTWSNPQSIRVKVGAVAGSKRADGYIEIGIDGKSYFAHRLVWLYVHGEFPPQRTDHINGLRDDNRIANLRLATPTENRLNSRTKSGTVSGYKGVCFHPYSGLWRAAAKVDYKSRSLGYYKTAEEAAEAYQRFAREAHGEFYRPDERLARFNQMKAEV